MSQQCILNEPSLNSNTEKTRLCVDKLTKVRLEAQGRSPCVSPESDGSVFANARPVTLSDLLSQIRTISCIK